MYLKSIEVHGFKSFANKMVLDFHNGITGIVGPNGSGKSNVSDAVRWVLGEQSARQLRGSSMQDVIFSGAESRKPFSYAYVAITMDNSDHVLDIDFEEVTVARRVYRSGESEYLLNGSPCRLKDVNELFYDTGIGKEGYSIIGQGQIEKILNGRPEEKRELFDEAAGIVKFKRRKAAALKKLEAERENMLRICDILSELERQAGPLEHQSNKAKSYLKMREKLKGYDANLFLMEMEQIDIQMQEAVSNCQIAQAQLEEESFSYESTKEEYKKAEESIASMEAEIEAAREALNESTVLKGSLEGQRNVLKEQLKAFEMTDMHFKSRMEEMEIERIEKARQKEDYEAEKMEFDKQLAIATTRRKKAEGELKKLQEEIRICTAGMESGQSELLELLNCKASIQSKKQKYDTMLEQAEIRKAQLNQQLLKQKSEDAGFNARLNEEKKAWKEIEDAIAHLKQEEWELSRRQKEWDQKLLETEQKLSADTSFYHKTASRLESLKNIAERYDGYGSSIKKVMEQKESVPGLLGVVSDLIQTDEKYETAIETALGGSIQNIVTEDEQTAKEMIAYLKQNRFGRATFLPLATVKKRSAFPNQEALKEAGVIGLADTLVKCDEKYSGIAGHLLGRIIVSDSIGHAIALAKKYHQSLSIVTLEGEFIRPGGSMTGGAYKNSSNLLGRNREIEKLNRQVKSLQETLEASKRRREEILTAQALLLEDFDELKERQQQQYLLENTAKINAGRIKQQKEESEQALRQICLENQELEEQIKEMENGSVHVQREMEEARKREEEIVKEGRSYQETLDEQMYLEGSVNKAFLEIQMEEANIRQKGEFVSEHIERICQEIEKYDIQKQELVLEAESAREDARKKEQEIVEIGQAILASEEENDRLNLVLKEKIAKSRQMAEEQKGFFEKREELSGRMGQLDKEIFRLNGQKERLKELKERQSSYMWEEYELTAHSAKEFRREYDGNQNDLKKEIARIKEEIKNLGDVNIHAIEEYKEVFGRYQFLKSQHDDLIKSKEVLTGIIEELDAGMRKQFAEKFADIKKEFDKAFQELFGGGKGTLELVEEEDLLECGIRITAQPPGKKLQNMVLLSGGEKSLTAIALLFAIQNLKPSPFCLLDEIEAALDDSNVGRFAKYLHKLTKNTQFIVITHRRGTMASADRLYGITMQEKGVSTLVSVDLIENDLTK